ncbi:MAG: hypothetical protein GY716_06765 [bacterium]|nr:hypothetical protein [bacterium]
MLVVVGLAGGIDQVVRAPSFGLNNFDHLIQSDWHVDWPYQYGFTAYLVVGLVLLIGASRIARWLLRPLRVCPQCGYDVRGIESGKCPECGAVL